MNTNKKQILLIAPMFFDYYKDIIAELEKLGYDVTFVPDTHSNSNIVKAIGRVNRNLIKNRTHNYFISNVLPLIKEKNFSIILIIGGMTFSYVVSDVEMLRYLNRDARLVIFQWDSEKNIPYFSCTHRFADKIFSFDKNDCEKNGYTFLPLFYTSEFAQVGKFEKRQYKYDCSYIGTAHPKKYVEINMISKAMKERFPEQFIYHYMPSKLKYYYHKLTSPEYRNAKKNEFQYDKMTRNEIVEIINESFCILDALQEGQTGLTMRAIECLGAKKKLITTNADIKNYDFYDERNVLVFDGKVDYNSSFFTEPYREIPQDIYNRYSLNSWLKILLSD